VGGKLHLRLNIDERPIANKYREGKLKRTLKRELKVREIADREPKNRVMHDALMSDKARRCATCLSRLSCRAPHHRHH
jgi:hypothetical protein